VRPVEARDLDRWIAMRCALHPDEPRNELGEEAARFLAGGQVVGLEAVLVCELPGGRVAGFVEIGLRNYAEGCRSSPVPYVEAWYVVPEERRAGTGGALIEAAEAWAAGRGYTEIASDALIEKSVSEAAHKALGFEEVERSIHFRKDLNR
jgi:aminoglycoside 6'-N-acetyltransferase I